MILILIFISSSCDKYLDVQSDSGLEVPQSLESFQKLLDASYHMNVNLCSNGEVSADDYFLQKSAFESISEDARNIYLWRNEKYTYDNDWARAYIPVYTSNLILDGLKELPITQENETLWNQVYGSALFFRANQFLSLVWTFSMAYKDKSAEEDLGIILRTTSDPNVKSTRASLQETYDLIINDLKTAADLLPKIPLHVMRPSKTAAYGSLARIYLSMGDYESAYYYTDRALAINNQLLNFNSDDEINPSAAYPFKRFNKETVFYVQLASTYPHLNPFYGLIDTTLFASYDENDLRKTLYFKEEVSGYQSFRGGYSETTDVFGGITTSELYLIRAECSARLGKIESALKDLNNLLTTRWREGTFTPYTIDTQKNVVNIILEERRKELVMRGLRWIDIKRLNVIEPQIILERKLEGEVFVLSPNDLRYALPLPDDIINVTGLPQNPR